MKRILLQMSCLCTPKFIAAVTKCRQRANEKEGVSPINAGRFYLQYISVTGSFPLSGIWRTTRKIDYNWTSPKVAYSIGIILFTILYGYNRIEESLEGIMSPHGKIKTDQLVKASMIISSPIVSVINMTGMLLKAPQLKTFLERWGQHRLRSSYKKPQCVLLFFLLVFLACIVQTLAPGVFHVLQDVTMKNVYVQVSDGLFWMVSIPAITAPSCLYYFVTACMAIAFSDLAQGCEEAAIKSQGTAKHGETYGNGIQQLKIQDLIGHYKELKDTVQEANSVFSPLLLLTLVYFGVELCMFLYDAMITILFQEKNQGFGIELMYATFFLLLILAVIEGAQAVEDQSGRCIEWLGDVALETLTQEERNHFSAFYPSALTKPITCHASNFFTINRRLLVAVLSATFTYIIILVQFKKSESVSLQMIRG